MQLINTHRLLDIKLEAQIGERGFRVYNSSNQLVSMNLLEVVQWKPDFNAIWFI